MCTRTLVLNDHWNASTLVARNDCSRSTAIARTRWEWDVDDRLVEGNLDVDGPAGEQRKEGKETDSRDRREAKGEASDCTGIDGQRAHLFIMVVGRKDWARTRLISAG